MTQPPGPIHDLRLLRALVAVAQDGNVTRAAERLNISQPALSVQLRHLSRISGLTLFTRTAQGMDITPDGAALAAKSERILAAMQDLNGLAQAMRSQLSGPLRIGTIIDPEFTRLGTFLRLLVERAPGVSAQLVHGVSGDVTEGLRRDRLDAGFYLGALDQPGEAETFHARPLTTLGYRVVAPRALADRLAGHAGPDPTDTSGIHGPGWSALADLPWIGTPPRSVHHRLLSQVFATLGRPQRVVAEADQEASMLAMVRTGVGLSLCRDSLALREAQAGHVVIVPGIALRTRLQFLTLAARREDPAIAMAFEVIAAAWPDTMADARPAVAPAGAPDRVPDGS